MAAFYTLFVFPPLKIIANGILIFLFWGWFVAPLGMLPVGLAHAIGLSCLPSCFFIGLSKSHSAGQDKSDFAKRATMQYVFFWLTILATGRLALAAM